LFAATLLTATIGVNVALAPPRYPDPATTAVLRKQEQALRDPRVAADVAGFSVNPSSRVESRAFFRAVYNASENASMQWTGSLSGTAVVSVTGTPGDTAAAYKEAVRLRINWFRAMAGVPATVQLDSVYNAKAQQAALMMTANNELNHYPPPSWLLYTAEGAEAADKSDLALGSSGPDAITSYLGDYGANNAAIARRRWLLYPQTQTMGTGDIPATGSFLAANATWVIDGNYYAARPAVRDEFVAWPAPGYVPYPVVFPRWSFSYPQADFSAATVSVTCGGSAVPVRLETVQNGYGENTLVWACGNLDTDSDQPLAKPATDTAYAVQVSGVVVGGQTRTFNYTVTVFDPAMAGPGETEIAVTGPTAPVVNQASSYNVARPSSTDAFQWRTIAMAAAGGPWGAEQGGLQGLVATTTGTYGGRDATVFATGTAAYHLAHPTLETQTLQLPGSLFVAAGASASLAFSSRLGWATTDQVAHVQVSFDDGATWSDLYAQAGTSSAGETSFISRTVALSALAGRVFQVRFTYTLGVGSYYPQTSSGVGWYIDDIALTGVSTATPGTTSAALAATSFAFTPAAAGDVGLQARGLMFSLYPIEWGPVTIVNAAVATAPAITTQPTSQTVAAGVSVTFTVTATGTPPLSYQWKMAGTAIVGATNSAYTIASVQANDAGSYTVVVTNTATSVTSDAATLTVNVPPTVPTVAQALPSQTFLVGAGAATIDLRSYFSIPGVSGQVAQFDTVTGKINVELLAGDAPLTVANFLNYVNRGAYTNCIIHRSVPGFIIQGGGYFLQNNSLSAVSVDAPVRNEFKLSNVRGTLAMAKSASGPDTATSQWFVNLTDNRANLDNQNGGFTVFARVLGTGMTVVDGIAAVPVYDASGPTLLNDSNFASLPLLNAILTAANLVLIRNVATVPIYPVSGAASTVLTFTAQSSDPGVVTVSLDQSNLVIAPVAVGSTTITVTATDTNGNTASGTIAVAVMPCFHSADTDGDGRISLVELTRVIELYNTRNATVRTGCYAVAATTSEDGFAADPTRAASAAVTLTKYHSADSNQDGQLTLTELTRVIELYNSRRGTRRTGQYHVQAGSEDGFAPGP
jgi:cyclophilin family peptidyl-prolyl cis-trans isomerase